jgi:hypothetical protein
MIRLIIVGVIGLLLGMGGGTGVAVLRGAPAVPADSAAQAKAIADSIAAHAEGGKSHGDSTQAPGDSAHASDSSKAGTPVGHGAAEKAGEKAGEKTAVSSPDKNTATHEPLTTSTRAAVTNPPKATSVPKANASHTDSAMHPATSAKTPASNVKTPAESPKSPNTAASTTAVSDSAQPRRIARIFAAMAARDAAKVMVQLDDADVQAIVGALTEKQAAAILANFPPERAAKISKGTMHSTGPSR